MKTNEYQYRIRQQKEIEKLKKSIAKSVYAKIDDFLDESCIIDAGELEAAVYIGFGKSPTIPRIKLELWSERSCSLMATYTFKEIIATSVEYTDEDEIERTIDAFDLLIKELERGKRKLRAVMREVPQPVSLSELIAEHID